LAFAQREVRRALTGKLGMTLDVAKGHPLFAFWHDGQIVAKTHISHGAGKEVSDGVISAMARQLGIRAPELRGAIDCSVSRESFSEMVLRRTG
jgi:hypothetical protein